jgi:hypothetical protein
MNGQEEELIYEQKLDRITELLEELALDAILVALQKIKKRNLLFSETADKGQDHSEPF